MILSIFNPDSSVDRAFAQQAGNSGFKYQMTLYILKFQICLLSQESREKFHTVSHTMYIKESNINLNLTSSRFCVIMYVKIHIYHFFSFTSGLPSVFKTVFLDAKKNKHKNFRHLKSVG